MLLGLTKLDDVNANIRTTCSKRGRVVFSSTRILSIPGSQMQLYG